MTELNVEIQKVEEETKRIQEKPAAGSGEEHAEQRETDSPVCGDERWSGGKCEALFVLRRPENLSEQADRDKRGEGSRRDRGKPKNGPVSHSAGLFFILGLVFSITLRLLWIQTVDASDLRKRAEKIWEKQELIEPSRGQSPTGTASLWWGHRKTSSPPTRPGGGPEGSGRKIVPILNIPRDDLYRKLSDKGLEHVKLMGGGTYKVSRMYKSRSWI